MSQTSQKQQMPSNSKESFMNLTFNSENQNNPNNQENQVANQNVESSNKQFNGQCISAIEKNPNETPVDQSEDLKEQVNLFKDHQFLSLNKLDQNQLKLEEEKKNKENIDNKKQGIEGMKGKIKLEDSLNSKIQNKIESNNLEKNLSKDQFKNSIEQKKQYQSKESQNQEEKDKIKLEDIFESKIHYNQNLKEQNIKGQSQSNNDMAEIKHHEKIEKYDQNQILLNLASAIEKLDSTLTNFVNVQSKINEDQSSLNASFKKSMDEQLSLFRKSIENQNTFNNMVFQWMQNQQGQNQGKNPGN